MYIDADIIIKIAALLSAVGALIAALFALFRVLERDKRQSEAIRALRDEQTIICYGLKGALQGLIEQGCNGPCKDSLQHLEKHLNQQAHKHEL